MTLGTRSPPALALIRQRACQLPPGRPLNVSSRPLLARPSRTIGTRHYANYYPHLEQTPKKGVKIGHLFAALALVGAAATAFGLYDFYQSFKQYPSDVRQHLRQALRAVNDGAFERAHTSFKQAYDATVSLANVNQLGTSREQALMRMSGIGIKWAAMWEQAGQLGRAIQVYELALQDVLKLSSGAQEPSKAETMRAVAIAMKLGDCLVAVGGKDAIKAAEERYTFCVEEMMRMNLSPVQRERVKAEMETGQARPAEGVASDRPDDDLALPEWSNKVELVAGMERLAELYARQGNIEYARPLFQNAIAQLLPPPAKGVKPTPPPVAQRCHAATLMNNLASALVIDPSPSASAIDESARWARQSLSTANQCRKEAEQSRKGQVVPFHQWEDSECSLSAIVSSFNLGKLAEMSGDKASAKSWFNKSLALANKIGSRDGAEQSREALRRL
ncbi:hypothetical protein OIV83_003012 [Microbotryomycetes sp. JL201]|nr:hypothetical protein OIV83_003012 [Microbotryomycetes sp. JL201]